MRSADKLYFALEFYSRDTNKFHFCLKFLLRTIYRDVPGETERKNLRLEIYRHAFTEQHSVKF